VIEDAIGSPDHDDITGNDTADTLIGGAGNDEPRGGKGADALSGDEGHDILDGGQGADSMRGGLGDDIDSVDHDGDTVSETVGLRSDPFALVIDAGSIEEVRTTLSGYTLPQTLSSAVENLTFIGTGVAFFGAGNSAADRFTGGSDGQTSMFCGAGADTLIG
jgi:Ca2+-binding RTX toxin-like protein